MSDENILWVTPSSLYFKIWPFIIALFDISALYSLFFNFWSPKTSICFIYSNICIGIWSYVFTAGTSLALIISALIIFALIASNEIQWMDMCKNGKKGWKDVLVRNSFAFGQGWFIAAASLSYGIVLVHVIGMSLQAHTIVFWVFTPLTYIFFIYMNITSCPPFWNTLGLLVSMSWALFGAAYAAFQPHEHTSQ